MNENCGDVGGHVWLCVLFCIIILIFFFLQKFWYGMSTLRWKSSSPSPHSLAVSFKSLPVYNLFPLRKKWLFNSAVPRSGSLWLDVLWHQVPRSPLPLGSEGVAPSLPGILCPLLSLGCCKGSQCRRDHHVLSLWGTVTEYSKINSWEGVPSQLAPRLRGIAQNAATPCPGPEGAGTGQDAGKPSLDTAGESHCWGQLASRGAI